MSSYIFKCLFIDDNEMVDTSDLITTKSKKRGINVEFLEEVNIGADSFDYLQDERRKLDKNKIDTFFKDNFSKQKIDLFLVDFDYEDEGFNGIDMIRIIRKYNQKASVFLYSGNLDGVIKNIIAYDEEDRIKKTQERVKTLVNGKIESFGDRANIIDNAVTFLFKVEITVDDIFLQKIEELPPCNIHFPLEKGLINKSRDEIIELLQNSVGKERKNFISEFIERSLAPFVKNYGDTSK